jgi:hypothetical protein
VGRDAGDPGGGRLLAFLSPSGDNAARFAPVGGLLDGWNQWRAAVPGLFDEQIVYGALDAIEQALEQALTARTEIQQRWQLNQLRGLLLTLPSNGLGLEDSLRQLIRLLRTPVVDQ